MGQGTPIRVTPNRFDFLEPAIRPSLATLLHGRIAPAGAGLTKILVKGQVMRQKNDGTNVWDKDGVATFTGPVRLIKYPIIIDENGLWQYGAVFNALGDKFQDTVAMYDDGFFKCQDIRGTSEVQTETVTATGGTRTLTVKDKDGVSATTGALAYNANAATIQAAIEGLANVEVGDVVVTGTGPFVYTFGGAGNFGGRDIPLIVIGTGSLTGGSSTMAQTGPLNTVGKLHSGTYTNGILRLGAATPV